MGGEGVVMDADGYHRAVQSTSPKFVNNILAVLTV